MDKIGRILIKFKKNYWKICNIFFRICREILKKMMKFKQTFCEFSGKVLRKFRELGEYFDWSANFATICTEILKKPQKKFAKLWRNFKEILLIDSFFNFGKFLLKLYNLLKKFWEYIRNILIVLIYKHKILLKYRLQTIWEDYWKNYYEF